MRASLTYRRLSSLETLGCELSLIARQDWRSMIVMAHTAQ